jgi:hypothetical protein
MAIKFNGQVYLFEFKVVEEEAEGRALRQIREKQYADKYRALDQPIHSPPRAVTGSSRAALRAGLSPKTRPGPVTSAAFRAWRGWRRRWPAWAKMRCAMCPMAISRFSISGKCGNHAPIRRRARDFCTARAAPSACG